MQGGAQPPNPLGNLMETLQHAAEGRVPGEEAAPVESAPGPVAPRTFYSYTDKDGTSHIVDSLEAVPKAQRKSARTWDLLDRDRPAEGSDVGQQVADDVAAAFAAEEGATGAAPPAGTFTTLTSRAAGPAPQGAGDLFGTFHLPSALVGLALGALLFLTPNVMRRGLGRPIKLALGFIAIALAGTAYLGWIRQEAGLGDAPLARPKVLIHEAREAARAMEEANRARQRQLDELEPQSQRPRFVLP